MLNFDNVRRENKTTVTAVLDSDIPAIMHWMKELGVTGWAICDRAEVRKHLGNNFPLVTELPVWPDMPDFTKTTDISYFVSFYNNDDIRAKLDEILKSKDNTDWKLQVAAEAAKTRAYQEAFEKDPSPFDFRRDL